MEIAHNNGQMEISKPSGDLRSGIRKQLIVLAEARQAAVSDATLQVYSAGLEMYDPRDIREAVKRLSLRRRREGETAFPDLPTMRDEVREAQADRRSDEKTQRILRESAERAADYKAHPEKYCTVSEIMAELKKKKSMEATG